MMEDGCGTDYLRLKTISLTSVQAIDALLREPFPPRRWNVLRTRTVTVQSALVVFSSLQTRGSLGPHSWFI